MKIGLMFYSQDDSSDVEKVILTATFYPTIFLMVLLNIFADKSDLKAKEGIKTAPENEGSFLSSVMMSWLDAIVWKGYKHGPLTQVSFYIFCLGL